MDQSDTSYSAGILMGRFVIFPLVLFGLGYLAVKMVKKRKPTNKEKIIIGVIAVVLTLFLVVANAAMKVGQQL